MALDNRVRSLLTGGDNIPDQRRRIAHGRETLVLDEEGNVVRELGEVGLHVVLQDQSGQRPRGIILSRHLGEDVDEIIVEVWVLIQLLQLGLDFSLCCCVWTLGFLIIWISSEKKIILHLRYLEKLENLA